MLLGATGPAGANPIIRLRGVRFSYDGQRAVHSGLDFGLAAGSKVGIMGPNGAGKTSLFHLVVGLLRPSAGEVEVFGQPRRQEADFREVRTRVGMLFQDPEDQLFCPTVGEDIAFGPLNLGKDREEVSAIVRETLALLDLEHLEERVTHHLSGGEKRLVSLATVLAMRPEVLLLDEPTAGLAEGMVDRVTDVLAEHVTTCVIISHNRAFLDRNVDQLYDMRDGVIVAA